MSIRKRLIVLLFLTVPVITATCQSELTGYVTTKENIKLPFTTVTLYADSIVLQNVVCDSNGYFNMQSPKPIGEYAAGALRLRAFYKHFSSDRVIISPGNSVVHLIVNDTAKVLSAVIVEADVSRVSRLGDRFVFMPSRSLTKGSDAFDVLRHVPLIKVEDQSDAFSIINKSSTVIYINNKKSEIPKEMIVQQLRSMPADNIISIEVITNPGSEYASNITGGIININLRRAFHDGWQGSLTALTEQSKYNTSILNGGITYRKGTLAINLIPFFNRSFNYYRLTNDVVDLDNNLTRYNTEYHRKYFVAGGGINIDYQPSSRSYFGLKYWQTNVSGHPEMTTSSLLTQPGKPDTFSKSSSKGHDAYLYNFGNVNYHYNLDSLGRNYIDVNVDFNRFNQDRTIEGAFDLESYRNVLPQKFRNLSEQVDIKKVLSSNTSMLFGIQLSHTKVENDLRYYDIQQNAYILNQHLSQDYRYREDYQAAYISMNHSFGRKLSTAVGLRLERTNYESAAEKSALSFDSTYFNLYPSLSASYFVSQKHQFGYSLSRKIIRPDFEKLYPGRIYRSDNYFTENNPFLQPTLLFVQELSYLLNRKHSFSITLSSTKNSNAKFVIPVTEDGETKFKETLVNYGRIRQLSIVFNTSINFLKGWWQLYLTPYYNHVEYSGNIGPGKLHVVNNDFNLIADNYFQLSRNKTLAAFLTFNFNSAVKDISSERTNPLSSLTFQLRKTVKQFTFSLIASDLYNGKSHTASNFYTNYLLGSNHADRYTYTRAIQFKVRYSFGNSNITATKNRNTANQEIRNRTN